MQAAQNRVSLTASVIGQIKNIKISYFQSQDREGLDFIIVRGYGTWSCSYGVLAKIHHKTGHIQLYRTDNVNDWGRQHTAITFFALAPHPLWAALSVV